MSYNSYRNFNNQGAGEQVNEEKKSKYNAAVSQIYRLDSLFQKATLSRSVGNLKRWNWILDGIWIELASDASEEHEKIFTDFVNEIVKYKDNKAMMYQTLMKKEIWIRKLQNKQGKGTAYQDGSEDDFD